jgi:hypothetical protein
MVLRNKNFVLIGKLRLGWPANGVKVENDLNLTIRKAKRVAIERENEGKSNIFGDQGTMFGGGGRKQNPHLPNDAMVWSQQCL